ncbi:hypothetical protein NC653_029209 [Populus alba x Populus x berolinensis]|uniref:Uncharacterized protein n=1 Tax=Populus alba x Populus x berolinensis TaxID=444605 RepID=A0AAD6M2M2_9ROSI|nr:hypothetical protein NC653_029209 [Populus alba x Populus x berolinensis]
MSTARPGYTSSAATIVSPSVFFSSDGKRKTQAKNGNTANFYGNKKNNDKHLEAGLNGNVQSEDSAWKGHEQIHMGAKGWGFPS